MGTTDLDLNYDLNRRDTGYHWKGPDKELRKKLYNIKAVEPGEDESNPNGPFEEYYPCYRSCLWHQYHILECNDNFRPVTNYFEGPAIEDAAGYNSDEYGDREDG